jgi:hypothetical protein
MNAEAQCQKEKKSSLKSGLTFFNSKVTQINNQRLQLNRSKGMARYLAKSYQNPRDLALLDTTMGVMSFTLYMMRFSANIVLLTQLIVDEPSETSNDKIRRDIYYSLWNDSLWATVNLTQFFWLSFSNSESAGFFGLQLEVIAQLIDVLVMVIRFQEYKEEYDAQYKQATEVEKARLAIEWQNKSLNFIRSLITASSIAVVLGLLAFSVASIPVSPILSSILLLSSLLRVLVDWNRDNQLIHQMRLEGINPQQIEKEERALIRDRLNDLNQVALQNVFFPVGIFLLITSPVPLLLLSLLAMAVIHYGTSYLIDTAYDVYNEETNYQLG